MPDPAAVMFDLDGTLADTLADIAASGNFAFASVDAPTYPVDRYRTLAGQGLERLIRDGLPPQLMYRFDEAYESFRGHYAVHRYDHCRPYAGVADLLDELTRRGTRLAVMSNKPDEATRDMVQKVFARWTFDAVRGHRAGYAVKPDPTATLEIAAELDIPPQRWWYVGDTDVDMHTGRAAGFHTVGVTWGFRDETELRAAGAQRIIHHPLELLQQRGHPA